jgi:ribosome-binding protein aMBF1 (putative translation factor)
VNKGWSDEKVAAVFNISVDAVRSANQSIAEMIKNEAKRLEQQML